MNYFVVQDMWEMNHMKPNNSLWQWKCHWKTRFVYGKYLWTNTFRWPGAELLHFIIGHEVKCLTPVGMILFSGCFAEHNDVQNK